MCGDGIREAKAHLALKTERDVTGNKVYFYRYVGSKMEDWKNVMSLLNGKKRKKALKNADVLSIVSPLLPPGEFCFLASNISVQSLQERGTVYSRE